MCGKMMENKGYHQGSCSNGNLQEFHGFQEDHLLGLGQEEQEQQQGAGRYEGMGGCDHGFGFQSEPASIQAWSLPQVHPINPLHFSTTTVSSSTITTSNPIRDHDDRLFSSVPPPPLPPPLYGDFYTRRAASSLQFGYDGGMLSSDPLAFAGLYMGGGGGSEVLVRGGGGLSSSSPFASIHTELGKMSAQEIMDAKALAASKSHSEAERRRRERINAHLAKLRSLLPSTTKTDKASLLAEVIQHVKELKRQTSEIAEESPLPTESDELTVDAANDEDGKFIVKASLCCEDRSDLIPELIKALKALRLRTLKAEITTLGGRIKNVLVITGENDSEISNQQQQSITSIQDALRAVMERTSSDDPSSTSVGGIKRQRTTNLSSILEHRSI